MSYGHDAAGNLFSVLAGPATRTLTGLKMIPNPYIPEDTIFCGPKTFEMLTGITMDEAMNKFSESLKTNAPPTEREGEK